MTNTGGRTLLFDLGGVVFELAGIQSIAGWTGGRLSNQDLLDRWLASPAVREFESGQLDFAAFRRRLTKELDLAVSEAAFEQGFRHWIRGLYPGARDLLRRLAGGYEVACFSNTNPIHWQIMIEKYHLHSLFETRFASFEMGLVKPDAAAFAYVLAHLPGPPESVVFFDDSPANIAAAREAGMQACCVEGIAGVREAMQALGLDQ